MSFNMISLKQDSKNCPDKAELGWTIRERIAQKSTFLIRLYRTGLDKTGQN